MSIHDVADQICEGLYLGNRMAPVCKPFILEHRIEVVVSILTDPEFHDYKIDSVFSTLDVPPIPFSMDMRTSWVPMSIDWHQVRMDDCESQDISTHFRPICEVIHQALSAGKSVLVHCAYGISRSATLVLAYMMFKNHWTRKQAMEYVSKRRKCIAPNDGFMNALKVWETNVCPTN